ncbi:MAG: 4Fe-4S binding protein [Thermoplasmata archaeon]
MDCNSPLRRLKMAPKINGDSCSGCGACVDQCPTGVLALKDGIATVANPGDCSECGACVDACPSSAITL